MVLIAFDYGEKRIGVAVTDESGKITTSLPYISNKSEVKRITKKEFPQGTDIKIINKARKDAKIQAKVELRKIFNIICHLLNTYYPDKIIFGLPMTIDKETNNWIEGHQAKKVKSFSKKLQSFLKSKNVVCDVEFVEESMTSKQAEDNLKQMGLSNEKVREKVDGEAARLLLEDHLNK